MKFAYNFNKANYEAIFDMFSNSMQQALPKERTLTFLKNKMSRSGKIQNMEFSKVQVSAHIYKTTFQKEVSNIMITLDNKNKISGLYIKPYIPKDLPKVERNTTKMILPFNEEWTVGWGGITIEDNYHVAHNNQKFAYDLLIKKEGKTFDGDADKNESYYAFGKRIIAPCDATVVKVIRNVKDNIPGELNPAHVSGNTVILETENDEFILFAHFKEDTIKVLENQIVKQGDFLGLCGNSGNSSEPHLHLSLQNVANMNIATGGKLFFEKIKVNGNIKEDYIPVKNEKIQNIDL